MPEDANIQAEEQVEGQVEGQPTPEDSGGEEKKSEEPTITEAQLKKRLYRERKKWEDAAAEEARKAQMSAEERLKAEKEDAEKRAADRVSMADQRLIKAEAKSAAGELGIRPDRVEAALKFADLSDIEVSEDGDPDALAVRAALQPVLQQFPEWGKPQVGKAPGNVDTGGNVPRGLDAEIQEAMDKGDFMRAEQLHAQKLASQGKLNHPM